MRGPDVGEGGNEDGEGGAAGGRHRQQGPRLVPRVDGTQRPCPPFFLHSRRSGRSPSSTHEDEAEGAHKLGRGPAQESRLGAWPVFVTRPHAPRLEMASSAQSPCFGVPLPVKQSRYVGKFGCFHPFIGPERIPFPRGRTRLEVYPWRHVSGIGIEVKRPSSM